MRFTVEQPALKSALDFVARFSPSRTTMPILATVLVEAHDGKVTVTATNLDRIARESLPAQVDASGRACLPADLLHKMAKGGAGEISVECGKDNAIIRAGKSRLTAQTLPADDFPLQDMFTAPAPVNFTMPGAFLAEVEKAVTFARSDEETRFYLNGTSWMLQDGCIEFAATDGHRAAVLSSDMDVSDLPAIIVPDFGMPEWQGDVSVAVSTFIRFNSGDRILASKLIDGSFPDYRRIITQNPTKIKFDRSDLLAAINRCGIVAETKTSAVLVVGRSGNATVSSSSPAGEVESEIAFEGDDFQISVQGRYLASILNSFYGERVEMRFADHMTPATFHDPSDDRRVTVLMPLRDPRLEQYAGRVAA